ncbi:MAG: TetR/AcrR family transcriptional regulator [Christensenellales bacterium]
MPRSDRRVQYTHTVLKESLLELLTKKPISQITIKEICEIAEVNRSTFYAHFSDQYELFKSMKHEMLNKISDDIGGYLFEKDKSEPMQILLKLLEFIQKNNKLWIILLSENGDRAFVHNMLVQVLKNYDKELLDNQTLDEKTSELVFLFMVNGCIGIIEQWIQDEMKTPMQEMAEFIIGLANQVLSGYRKK